MVFQTDIRLYFSDIFTNCQIRPVGAKHARGLIFRAFYPLSNTKGSARIIGTEPFKQHTKSKKPDFTNDKQQRFFINKTKANKIFTAKTPKRQG
ncbi:MAG: hypothetical protein HGA76_06510 [Candidatus Firestonebacteria bacterium]|nr:hypothetical protein [Candidatus Firestonebacteria bacterium]